MKKSSNKPEIQHQPHSAEGKKRAPRNRTLTLSESERSRLMKRIGRLKAGIRKEELDGHIFQADLMESLELLPSGFVDLLILDPPYNLTKDYHGYRFREGNDDVYEAYLESWFPGLLHVLAPNASVYLCGDWHNSAVLYRVMKKYLTVLNRITWQREKGRGARGNWKNSCEDIWFGTNGKSPYFNLDAVRLKRRVLAPYRSPDGTPKDWETSGEGNYRMTAPSNFWDDLSVPYWSMPENTDHPTQKPEKLLAKLILASSREDGFVLDPFLGSGTTAVVAKKLGRHFSGLEWNQEYCCWAEARLERAEQDASIQGYTDGVFWERNTLSDQRKKKQ